MEKSTKIDKIGIDAMRREEYKHLLNYAAILITLIVQTVLFTCMWYKSYVPVLLATGQGFFRRGNWAVIGIYILILFFMTNTLGGYKIAYLRISDMWLSQVLAILCANVVGYVQICIVGSDYMSPTPMVILTVAEILFVIPWIY